MMLKLPDVGEPRVEEQCYIAENAAVIGNVRIGRRVFVAPGAVIRADEEGSAVVIGDECNVQDGVIIHSLAGSQVKIGRGSSLAHGSIVHGPCEVGEECFIGFRATVFKAKLGDGCVVMHGALVVGVEIPAGRLVPGGEMVDSQEMVERLGPVPEELVAFRRTVKSTNVGLISRYSMAERR